MDVINLFVAACFWEVHLSWTYVLWMSSDWWEAEHQMMQHWHNITWRNEIRIKWKVGQTQVNFIFTVIDHCISWSVFFKTWEPDKSVSSCLLALADLCVTLTVQTDFQSTWPILGQSQTSPYLIWDDFDIVTDNLQSLCASGKMCDHITFGLCILAPRILQLA